MFDTDAKAMRPLLEAVAFAARAHQGKLRKDGATPYVSHVFRVCLVLRHVFGLEDRQALMAAALHDTVEDTDTDFDDLKATFGDEMAAWVAAEQDAAAVAEVEVPQESYVTEALGLAALTAAAFSRSSGIMRSPWSPVTAWKTPRSGV